MPDTPIAFAQSLDWTLPITWLGRAGYHLLDADVRARLELAQVNPDHAPQPGVYDGLRATIVSRTLGEIDRNRFVFDDYLAERADDRADWQPHPPAPSFQVRSRVGWHWYIAVPATTRPLTHAVEAWIDLYRSPLDR